MVKLLSYRLIESFQPANCDSLVSLIDSMLIITCAGRNKTGKVATEITSKGYCSTKNLYYFGMKLHEIAVRRKGIVPFLRTAISNSSTRQ